MTERLSAAEALDRAAAVLAAAERRPDGGWPAATMVAARGLVGLGWVAWAAVRLAAGREETKLR
jgi:hypothetical protein